MLACMLLFMISQTCLLAIAWSAHGLRLRVGQDCCKLTNVILRVPEECPLAIANLYLACTVDEARDRPSASALVRSLEDAAPGATGAEEP